MLNRNKITRAYRTFCFAYTLTVTIIRFYLQMTDAITDKHIPPLYYFTMQTLLCTTLHFGWNIWSTSQIAVNRHPGLFGPGAKLARVIFLFALINMTITVVLYWLLLAERIPVHSFIDGVVYFENISYHGIHILFLWGDLLLDGNLPLSFTTLDVVIAPIYIFCFVFFMYYVEETKGYWIYPVFGGELRKPLLFAIPIISVLIGFLYLGVVRILERLPYYRYTIQVPSVYAKTVEGSEGSTFSLRALYSVVSRDMSEAADNPTTQPPKTPVVTKKN